MQKNISLPTKLNNDLKTIAKSKRMSDSELVRFCLFSTLGLNPDDYYED